MNGLPHTLLGTPILSKQCVTLADTMAVVAQRQLRPLWADFAYKPHQEIGIHWMLERECDTGVAQGGILADEMGLGKTIQMVSLIRHAMKAPQEKNLLVAPVAVLEQWKTVVRQAGMTVQVPNATGAGWQIEGPVKSGLAPHVHMAGYQIITRHPQLVLRQEWTRCIYDEAHRLCRTLRTGEQDDEVDGPRRRMGAGNIALRCVAKHKWLLTATPIVNKSSDIMNLFRIVGVTEDMTQDYDGIVKKYVISRTMDQLRETMPDAPPMPEHTIVSLPFDTEEEASFYRGRINQITHRWLMLEDEGNRRGVALERLKLLMRLRQLSLHPQVYIAARKTIFEYIRIPDWEESSTKFNALYQLIEKEAGGGKKWIVFCHFKEEMRLLKEMLALQPHIERVQIYNGELNAAQRATVLENSYKPLADGKSEVLLVQLQSGGVGLNLQHFQRVVFSGPWWTQAMMDQAVGRAVRIGQREVVQVYHLRLQEEEQLNIDLYMVDKAEKKGELCAETLAKADRRVSY